MSSISKYHLYILNIYNFIDQLYLDKVEKIWPKIGGLE